MSILIFILVAGIAWLIVLARYLKPVGGLAFYGKNLGIALLIATCICAIAYVVSGFYCDGSQLCEQRFMVNSILVDSIMLFVWAIMLGIKKPNLGDASILDD